MGFLFDEEEAEWADVMTMASEEPVAQIKVRPRTHGHTCSHCGREWRCSSRGQLSILSQSGMHVMNIWRTCRTRCTCGVVWWRTLRFWQWSHSTQRWYNEDTPGWNYRPSTYQLERHK